jgi:hypothetical protein
MTNAAKNFVRRLIRMTLRDLLVVGLPLVILIVAGFWATYQLVQPAPPKRLVIATGGPEGVIKASRHAIRRSSRVTASTWKCA